MNQSSEGHYAGQLAEIRNILLYFIFALCIPPVWPKTWNNVAVAYAAGSIRHIPYLVFGKPKRGAVQTGRVRSAGNVAGERYLYSSKPPNEQILISLRAGVYTLMM